MMCDDGGGVLEQMVVCCVCVCGHGKRGREVRRFRERETVQRRESRSE